MIGYSKNKNIKFFATLVAEIFCKTKNPTELIALA